MLSPAQRVAIKKGIIVKAMKIYQQEKGISHSYCGSIFRWSKDPLLGDPEFYQKKMLPLQKVLDEYVAKVSPDMSDETVNDIYSNAVRGWHNFRLILQENRYRDLEDKLFEE